MNFEVVEKLSQEDETLLNKSVVMDPWKGTIEEVVHRLAENRVQVYRLSNEEMHGLIVTAIYDRGNQKTLFIEHLAGTGFLRYADEILEALKEVARVVGCSSVTGTAVRRGLIRIYHELGAKVESVNFRVEV